jgi:hypothetical protein
MSLIMAFATPPSALTADLFFIISSEQAQLI